MENSWGSFRASEWDGRPVCHLTPSSGHQASSDSPSLVQGPPARDQSAEACFQPVQRTHLKTSNEICVLTWKDVTRMCG